MITIPEGHVRFYEDGPWWPKTPTQQAAEQAYRDAFLRSARQAAAWTDIDEAAIERAWDERRRARAWAEVIIPSSVIYSNPDLDSDQVLYVEGHEVEAGRTRGRVHGFEFVRQCREELVKAGVAISAIGPVILVPWLTHVAEWVARDIDPERIAIPPRPEDRLTERQRRMLEKAKQAIAACDPNKPQAILQQLACVTREMLEWLWPGRIPLGKLTLLAGDPGLGKSFVTLDLAARVSRGDAWPDMPLFKQTPGGVILLNCEDDLGTVRAVLEALNVGVRPHLDHLLRWQVSHHRSPKVTQQISRKVSEGNGDRGGREASQDSVPDEPDQLRAVRADLREGSTHSRSLPSLLSA